MNNWEETQLQPLLLAQSEEELFTALVYAADNLGFEFCAYTMRIPFPIAHPKIIRFSNFPAKWQKLYIEKNYSAIDPTLSHAMRSVMPLLWSDQTFGARNPFWKAAQAHGLKVGWTQSCHDARGIGGWLSLARSENPVSPEELLYSSPKMSWLVQAAHEALARLVLPTLMPSSMIDLSAREIEVLRWTAEGKTSHEISEILEIAERTVNFHIKNALVKLGAANKTAAATKAAMLGLL